MQMQRGSLESGMARYDFHGVAAMTNKQILFQSAGVLLLTEVTMTEIPTERRSPLPEMEP